MALDSFNAFLSRTNGIGTLDLVKKGNLYDITDSEANSFYDEIVVPKLNQLKGLIYYSDIIRSIISGRYEAMAGNFRSAEENNRFIIERGCLSEFVEGTNKKYDEALKDMDWHNMVDRGYIISSFAEAMRRIRTLDPRVKELDSKSIFLAGKAVCKEHLEFPFYSITIKAFGGLKKVRCRCGNEADYLTLAMPKVSALIELASFITNANPNSLYSVYSNLSRVVHPYGFTDFPKGKSYALWLRDLNLILSSILNLHGVSKVNP
ncbi:hypothetical protein Mia14_1013 [Candidatus Mancarchaeum acidiphilum]|uniref:Uncharacterized protein n=1 Tax=Candidatus Mancarchaeum acidiphilum TaxID=1920749 RepID=A0A218NP70_9ARCH|nr:hypothetical protein [Candidatus Mancarchaeum acidiphilum]ASI14279.1 hypothetical protein Mia14_1013 [Candidatus Mancarchaeum acidiphilum]